MPATAMMRYYRQQESRERKAALCGPHRPRAGHLVLADRNAILALEWYESEENQRSTSPALRLADLRS